MKKNKKNIFRLLLSDIALFIFFVFVVSDLINMHIRLIYHIDLFSSQNVITGVFKKVKDEKIKIQAFYNINLLFDAAFNRFDFSTGFIKIIIYKINFSYQQNIWNCILSSRAPPTLLSFL